MRVEPRGEPMSDADPNLPAVAPASDPGPDLDHQRINALVASLRGATDPAARTGVIEEMAAQLERHFEAEEAGPFEQLRLAAPRWNKRVDALCQQHVALAAEVRALRALAHGGAPGLAAACFAFADRLAAHEANENRLMADVLYRDIGTCD